MIPTANTINTTATTTATAKANFVGTAANQVRTFSTAELSALSIQEKLDYFRNSKINHPILNRSFEELWQAVKGCNDGSLILLYGPTGIGKTTIMRHLEKRLMEELKDELLKDREMIPLVKAEIMGASAGKFDWKDFYREILLGLSEFGINNRIDLKTWENPHQPQLPFDNAKQLYKIVANDSRSTESRLRSSVENAFLHRRPKVVMLDEAQHLTALSSGRKLLDQQNVIKSLANRTKTTHALFGSYELMPLRDLNGQLARRTVNIHFRRYLNTSKQDMSDFENVVWSLQQKLPLEEGTDLTPLTNYLYEGCFGCVGILKDWLFRALTALFSEQGEVLNRKYLETTKLDEIKLVKIAQECISGERKLVQEKTEATAKLRALLQYSQAENNGVKVIKNTKKNANRNVGIRNPHRDQVGLTAA
jgi:energy-coupling factor transporter ATP-binding protein EcfA2